MLKHTLELSVKDISGVAHSPEYSMDSPAESVSPSKETNDVSPLQDSLTLKNMSVSVGRSPSDFHWEADEIELEKEEMKRLEIEKKKQEKLQSDFQDLEWSKDSMFEEENESGIFKQFEKVVSKESHSEQKTTKTVTSIEEKTISTEAVEGEPPKVVMEEKKFATEDIEEYSKSQNTQEELALHTCEKIKEEIELKDNGIEIKKENKELTAIIDEDSRTQIEETKSKSSTKKEDSKETIYPFLKKNQDASDQMQLVDIVSSKEESMKTAVTMITDDTKHVVDETKLTSNRELEVKDDTEQVVNETEITSEAKKHIISDELVEKGTSSVECLKKEEITEVLFDVNTGDKHSPISIIPVMERHGERKEQMENKDTFESRESTKDEISFDKSQDPYQNVDDKQHRDSGLFEESVSEDDYNKDMVTRYEHLERMAFDNMAFHSDDIVKPKKRDIKIKLEDQDAQLTKQHVDISPEDLKERPTRFDFEDEIKNELKSNFKNQNFSNVSFDLRTEHMKDKPVEDNVSPVIQDTEDLTDSALLEGAVGLGPPALPIHEESIDHALSSSSSSQGENEVFDRVTGARVPWEIQHQFSRQFSDSYSEQEDKLIEPSASSKSLDMGEFYERDRKYDKTAVDFSTLKPVEEKKQSTSSDEISPTTKKKMQKVRFSLSEERCYSDDGYDDERFFSSSYDMKISEEWKKMGTKDCNEISENEYLKQLDRAEPHEKITDAYQQAVIATILDTRQKNELLRQNEYDELQRLHETEPEIVAVTKVRVTSADTVGFSSTSSSLDSDRYEGDDVEIEEVEYDIHNDSEVEMVNTMSQTIETQQPLCVVSRESRLAQEELLKESFDERDRSMSPSLETEVLPTTFESQKEENEFEMLGKKFPLVIHTPGKALADNEVYESSETEHTTEDERLSPIEETSGTEAMEENNEDVSDSKTDKKVTFQPEIEHLRSLSSEDLVKTSTSSSEVEPTLLAASYDLDSGRVSHVVTAYDLSPDTVEKQFLPVASAPKTILSSPEDDVFEADLTICSNDSVTVTDANEETPTEGDVDLIPRETGDKTKVPVRQESGSTGTETLPSPPAPSPFEVQLKEEHTVQDLQGAALKMKQLQSTHTTKDTSEGDTLAKPVVKLLFSNVESEQDKMDDDISSPFEIMSPSELEDYVEYAEKQSKEVYAAPIPSRDVRESHSGLLSPEKSPIESSFEQSSPVSSETSERGFESPLGVKLNGQNEQKHDLYSATVQDEQVESIVITNGPTEVEYNPEIDLDLPSSTVHTDMEKVSESEDVEEIEDKTDEKISGVSVSVSTTTTQASDMHTSPQSVQIEQTSCSGQGQQTALTEGIIEELPPQSGQDILIVSDQTLYGLEMPSDEAASMTTSHVECDSLNVSVYTSTSVHDDTSEQVDSREVLGQIAGIDKTEEDISERPSVSLQEMPCSSETVGSRDTLIGELTVSAVQGPETEQCSISKQDRASTPSEVLEAKCQTYHKNMQKEIEIVVQTTDIDQYEENIEGNSPDRLEEEDIDDELMKLKDVSDYELDNRIDEEERGMKIEDRAAFELRSDQCDLERPLTPTPVDKNQGFFDEDFEVEKAREMTKDTKDDTDNLLEKTACEFIETVLQEVKVKVKHKGFPDLDDDVALVQSPLSETGGDITDFAEDLPYDETPNVPMDDEEASTDRKEEFLIEERTRADSSLIKDKHGIVQANMAPSSYGSKDISDKQDADGKIVDDTIFLEYSSTCEVSLKKVQADKEDILSSKVCIPEEVDDIDTSQIEETVIQSVSQQSTETYQLSKDVTDARELCRPEEADTEEVKDDEDRDICPKLISDIDETDTSKQSSSVSVKTQSEVSLSTVDTINMTSESYQKKISDSSVTESSISPPSAQVHFLEMSSDINAFSSAINSHEKGLELELNEEITQSDLKDMFYDADNELYLPEKKEKLHASSAAIAIPLMKKKLESEILEYHTDSLTIESKSHETDDAGDSSSVDSFTTVVAADEEEEDEDRLADFASLTSSIHSDIQGGIHTEEEEEKQVEGDPLQELIAWAKDKHTQVSFQAKQDVQEEEIISEEEKQTHMFPWNKDNSYSRKDDVKGIMPFPWRKEEEEDVESLGSSHFDYIDRQALSVITELSEEDRFEIIEKDELESESTGTGSDSRHYSSPDFPPPSPMSNLKFFNKSGERDDISVSSSLLEFERLEREINQSRSSGSLENGSKDSLGGSLDESKFLSKSLEKDDVSVTSSLSEFERLEREVAQGSSDSSVEKILSPAVISPPDTGKDSSKSSVSGSVTSLAEFEKLEKECMADDTRRSSISDSFSQKSGVSVTSSQASLNEFERLEQDFVLAEQLEIEAQKIVSILEAGTLIPNQYSSEPELSYSESLATTKEILRPKSKDDDHDKDSVDERDEIEDDSLSDNKKKSRGDIPDDTDSLDDQSDMTASITSAILKSESATKLGTEYDADSLHDSTHSSDGVMKMSSDSIGDKMGDSMHSSSDGMMKISTDSIGDKMGSSSHSSDGQMKISTDSLGEKLNVERTEKEKFDTDSLHEDEGIMNKSSDSLEHRTTNVFSTTAITDIDNIKSNDNHNVDSQQGQDVMQTSTDSLESCKTDTKQNIMEVSVDSTGTGWSSASSMFSRSSIDTMRSADNDGQSDSGHSHEMMEASMESWEEYGGVEEEEADNYFIISKYQSSLKEAAESKKSTKSEKIHFSHIYYDLDGNPLDEKFQYMVGGPGWNENFGKMKDENSIYLQRQPYEEKKKIFTMSEWEAMKKRSKQPEKEKDEDKTPEEDKTHGKTIVDKSRQSVMEETLTQSTLESETDSEKLSIKTVKAHTEISTHTLESTSTKTTVTLKGILICFV